MSSRSISRPKRRGRSRSSSRGDDDDDDIVVVVNGDEENRQHQQQPPPRPLITVAEFTSIMNGSGHDDPYSMIRALKQFAKTIRNERNFSLSSSLGGTNYNSDQEEDEEDSDNDAKEEDGKEENQSKNKRPTDDGDSVENDNDDGPEQNGPPKKKKKKYKEEWMMDTEAYNVPFVGTAVARGEYAPVQKGQWPTGLLLAYTTASPNAVELFGQQDDIMFPTGNIHKRLIRKKLGSVSRSLAKAHLFAIAEVLTVNQSTTESSTLPQPILVQSFIKTVLPWIYELINDETGKGRGKPGVVGGCGSLVEPALVVLRHVASVSLQHSRMVTRQLDEKLYDGVLRICLKPLPSLKKDITTETKKGQNQKQQQQPDETSTSSSDTKAKPVRTEAIRLATYLLNLKDGFITTSISTSGNRERKIKSGILYLVLREGFSSVVAVSNQHQHTDSTHHDVQYLRSVQELIRSIRLYLFGRSGSDDTPTTVGSGGSNRTMHDLLSRDPLTHLCGMVIYAPRLSSERTYVDVLNASDVVDNENLTEVQNIGIEARRLLFLLLSRPRTSPLLSVRPEYDQLAKVIVKLLNAPTSSLEQQKFVVQCTVETPALFRYIMRTLVLPDTKRPYKFISMTRFVTVLLRTGPSPLSCLESGLVENDKLGEEEILSVVVPAKFTGSSLLKWLHSSNPLTRIETLKMIIVFLERFEDLVNNDSLLINVAVVSASMEKALPGTQSLLSLRNAVGQSENKKATGLQTVFLFRAIEVYIRVLPLLVRKMKFDWAKIIPEDIDEFHRTSSAVQVIILRCFRSIAVSEWVDTKTLLLSSRSVFDIMASTRKKRVYDICRDIALKMLHKTLLSETTSSNSSAFIAYEASVWVDSLQPDCVGPFFQVLSDAFNNSLDCFTSFGGAMLKYNLSMTLNFSLVLVAALQRNGRDDNKDFSVTVKQVSTQCLLHLKDPIPLAAYIASQGKTDTSNPLHEYAEALVEIGRSEEENGHERLQLLENLLKNGSTLHTTYLQALQYLTGGNGIRIEELVSMTSIDSVDFLKFLRHAVIIQGCVSDGRRVHVKNRYGGMIKQILPRLILEAGEKDLSILADIYASRGLLDESDMDGINILVKSSPRYAKSSKVIEDLTGNQIEEMGLVEQYEERITLLLLYLAQNRLSHIENSKIALRLIPSVDRKTRLEQYEDFALQFLSSNLEDQSLSYQGLEKEISTAVNAWVRVSNRAKGKPPQSIERLLKASLCRLLSSVLMSKEDVASTALLTLEMQPPELVVGLCLDISNRGEACAQTGISLLESLLVYKVDGMTEEILEVLSRMNSSLNQAWKDGLLDRLLCHIILQTRRLKNPDLLSRVVDTTLALTSKRISAILSTDQVFSSAQLEVDALCHLLLSSEVTFIHAEEFSIIVAASCAKSVSYQSLHSFGICKVAVHLLRYLETACASSNPVAVEVLQTQLLVGLLALVRQSLKSRRNNSLSLQQKKSILQWTVSLLGTLKRFPEQLSSALSSESVMDTIKICLKRGITTKDGDSDSQLRSLAVQIVNGLVQFTKETSPLSVAMPPVSQVFEMATTHSKFSAVFEEAGEREQHAVLLVEELLKLLISCFETADGTIPITPELWKTVLSSFRAGMSPTDVLVRRLLEVVPDSHQPYTDEMRWHGISSTKDESSGAGGEWEWLVDGIDSSRVRATIQNFPVNDSLYAGKCTAQTDESDGAKHETKEKYSPGFLLPLLLSSVESPPIGIPTLRSMIDKGIIGLCLSSLSTNCDGIRMYAVAILGNLLSACQTDGARQATSWRDRPQVVMMLNAVQRFFVIHRSQDRDTPDKAGVVPKLAPIVANFLARASFSISKPDDGLYVAMNRFFLKNELNHGAFQDWNRAPGFISLFCASTEDPEEARVERLWALRMLCDGVLDEESYSFVSRSHAAELILSSFENVHASKFTPNQKEMEYILLLQSMTSMLRHGGTSASNQLIGRLGLMSWVRCWCDSKSMIDTFQSVRSRTAFCQLLKAMIRSSSENPRLLTSSLVHEACGLIQPVVSMLLLPNSMSISASSSSSSSSDTESTVLHECIAVLRDIAMLLGSLKDENDVRCSDVQPLGCGLESAKDVTSALIDLSHNEIVTSEFLTYICQLPVSIWSRDDPSAVQQFDGFVDLVLQFLAELDIDNENKKDETITADKVTLDDSTGWVQPIVQRILLIAKIFYNQQDDNTTNHNPLLLGHRSEEPREGDIIKNRLRLILIKYPYLSTKEGRVLWTELHKYLRLVSGI